MDLPRHILFDNHSLAVIASDASSISFRTFLPRYWYVSFFNLAAVIHIDSSGWQSPNFIAV